MIVQHLDEYGSICERDLPHHWFYTHGSFYFSEFPKNIWITIFYSLFPNKVFWIWFQKQCDKEFVCRYSFFLIQILMVLFIWTDNVDLLTELFWQKAYLLMVKPLQGFMYPLHLLTLHFIQGYSYLTRSGQFMNRSKKKTMMFFEVDNERRIRLDF